MKKITRRDMFKGLLVGTGVVTAASKPSYVEDLSIEERRRTRVVLELDGRTLAHRVIKSARSEGLR